MSHLRLAVSVGVVGGFALGTRESLIVLYANSFVQPGQYLQLYLVVPVLAWMGLGSVVMVAGWLLSAPFVRERDARGALGPYSAWLGLVGGLSITIPAIRALMTRLGEMGDPMSSAGRGFLWAMALAVAVGSAAVAGAAGAWYATRVSKPLRLARRCVLLAGVLMLWPVGSFFLQDWKFAARAPSPAAVTGDLPHVLLVSIDTLRADHLGAYGDTRGLTPRLDHLAADGVTFRQTITAAPWTLPAMASLFTGADPRHHGAGRVTNRRDPLGRSALAPKVWTLATELRAHGYRTRAIVTNPYLALRYGLGEGFDSYENVTIESEAMLAFGQTTAVRLANWLLPDLVIGDRGETVSARAQHWLAREAPTANRPLFLWLHYVDPHPPYSRARTNRHKSFRSDSLFAPPSDDAGELTLTSPDVARLRSGEIRLGAEQKEAVRALYRNEVASVDAAVGTVLDALDGAGLRRHTLVVCVADHGEEFWEHGGVEHGHTVYDELLRVPLLMRWPERLPAGARVESLVRLTDVAPTILDLIGLPVPATGLDGASLVPLINGEESAPRVAVSENLLFAEERVAVRTASHKYVRWESGREEVYDLAHDPLEQRDLAGVPAVIDPLRELYAAGGASGAAAAATPPTVDSRGAAALRALGYVQ